jgi:hypothetical protein
MMLDLVQGLNNLNHYLHKNGRLTTATLGTNRWNHVNETQTDVNEIIDMSRHSPHIATRIAGHADAAALAFAHATDGTMYNEHNVPNNTDSAHVFSWVIDKLHLADVPAHNLLPDPSYLPGESLRFFLIDENWTDALVDGALSLANHFAADPADDHCRTAIKKAINKALRTPDKKFGLLQMPKYGFIIRSQILAQFPDITVAVRYAKSTKDVLLPIGDPQPPLAPILVQKRICADCMYCLFDRVWPEINGITFTLPPHQQCFTVGRELTENTLTINIKRIYTTEKVQNPADRRVPLGEPEIYRPTDNPLMFDWKLRTLNTTAFANHQKTKLRDGLNGEFTDTRATSALLAIQLNDSILQLDIGDPRLPAALPPPKIFQLSVPEIVQTKPPALFPLSHAQTAKRGVSVVRPRPPSPHREAALIARHAAEAATSLRLQKPPIIEADRPKFKLKVYPIRSRDFVPSDSELPIDLVFSIRPVNPEKPDRAIVPLLKMSVEVPYGNMPDNRRGGPNDPFLTLLAEDADPPAPAMLSNLRFNVLKRFKKDKNNLGHYLVLDLVPRSKNGVLTQNILDASFLLKGAAICHYTGPEVVEPFVNLRYDYGDWGDKDWNDGNRVPLRPAKS